MVASASQGLEISNTLACYLVSCGMSPSVLNATADQTAEVTFGDVVTHTCDERTTDGGVFDGSTFFSIICSNSGSSTSVSTCSEPTFSFVAVVKRCDRWLESCRNCSHVGDGVPFWHSTSSVTGATSVDVPRDQSNWVGELGSCTAGEPVVVYRGQTTKASDGTFSESGQCSSIIPRCIRE